MLVSVRKANVERRRPYLKEDSIGGGGVANKLRNCLLQTMKKDNMDRFSFGEGENDRLAIRSGNKTVAMLLVLLQK